MNANTNRNKARPALGCFFHGAEHRWIPVRPPKTARISVIAVAAAAIIVAAPIKFDSAAGGPGAALNAAEAAGGGGVGGGGGGGVGGGGAGGKGGGGGGGVGGGAGGNGGGNNGGGNGGGNNGGGGGRNGSNGNGNQGAGAGSSAGASGGRGSGIAIVVQPRVAIAVLTTSIRKRKPANQIEAVVDPNQAVSFFTELEGMNGRTVKHRWMFDGDLKYEVPFEIRADRWRVWSTQLLPSTMAGTWNVQIVGEDGAVLQTVSLDYQPAG